MYACICRGITEQNVIDMVNHNCFTYAHYSSLCRGDKGCCKCLPRIKELINEEYSKSTRDGSAPFT